MSCIHFQKLDVCKTISKPFKPLKRVGLSVRPAGGITIRREEQLQTNLNPVFWLHIPLKQQSLMGGSLAPQSTFGSVWGHFWLPRLECCYWHLHGWRVEATVHRGAPTMKNQPAPDVKPCPKGRYRKDKKN